MTEQIYVTQPNNVFIKLACSQGLSHELSEYFSFMAPNHKHDKRFRNKIWDGKIRLFNGRSKTLHAGLFNRVKKFAKQYGYEVIDQRNIKHSQEVTDDQIAIFLKALNLPEDREPRDYQITGLKIAARDKRALLLSPTSSGKSLMIYMLCRWFNKKTLIIVPTTTLVRQMSEDFVSYNYERPISQILAGASKEDLEHITVSTWQSVYTMPPEWLSQFRMIIGDEAHGFKANSLKSIMENAANAEIRIGTTGTLDDLKVNELTLEGLFGEATKLISTRELMDRGQIADLQIYAYELDYPKDVKSLARKMKPEYDDEMNFIYEHPKRSKFVYGLVDRLKGNKMVLFKKVSHGKAMYEYFKAIYPNVHIVYGDIATDERNDIRALTELSDDAIIVASYKTFGTGISIINLSHVVLAAPIKSKITLIQAIGRALRRGKDKTKAYVHDIGDNLSVGQYVNHTYRHFVGRLELYAKEQLPFKLLRVQL